MRGPLDCFERTAGLAASAHNNLLVHSLALGLAGSLWLTVLAPRRLEAQMESRPYSPDERRWLDSNWREDVAFGAANALLMGLGVGIVRLVKDGHFWDGFGSGAFGGATSFLGRRIAAARFAPAGFIGREVNAVGASVAANATGGRRTLEQISLPVGPALVTLTPGRERLVHIGVDLFSLGWAAYALAAPSEIFDWRLSLASGTFVFVSENYPDYNGRAQGSVVFLSSAADEPRSDVLVHESVHVLQSDLLHILVGLPVEAALLGPIDVGPISLTTGLDSPVMFTLLGDTWIPRDWSPLEVEATYLEVR